MVTIEQVEPMRGYLERYASNILRDREDVRSVVNYTIWKAVNKGNQFKENCALRSWVTAILRNEIQLLFRERSQLRYKNTKDIKELPSNSRYLYSKWKNPAQQLESKNRMESTISKILTLPKLYRQIILLTLYFGDQKEVAKHLGIGYSAVKTRVLRARQLLKGEQVHC